MLKGNFIVLETGDGGGGTTQRDILTARLEENGVKVFATENPSKGPIGQRLRDLLTGQCSDRMDPTAHQMGYVTDRFDHHARVVEPARASGHVVVCSRWELSTVVYYAASLPEEQREAAIARAFDWHAALPAPTLTLVLAVPPEVTEQRRRDRKTSPEFFDATELQARVARLYAMSAGLIMGNPSALDRYGQRDFAMIDGTGSIRDVADRVWAAVLPTIEAARSIPGSQKASHDKGNEHG